ncbi:MAG: ergothioneine biosynthesis protein EgtB [Thermonemataceae bacterium]
MSLITTTHHLDTFQKVRARTLKICENLAKEDFVVQPIVDVSPPKWHLGHTTWFFETFLLKPYLVNYRTFHDDYNFIFNSYYETVGKRVLRADRGNLTRPTTDDVLRYRTYVDEQMVQLLEIFENFPEEKQQSLQEVLTIGLNHEEQHQELLITDIKYIIGHNPLFHKVKVIPDDTVVYGEATTQPTVTIPAGVYEIGYQGEAFHFDNEKGVHKVYVDSFTIHTQLVTNADYIQFIEAGGYQQFQHWLAEGWDWVKQHQVKAPLYWHQIDGQWWRYTFEGLQPVKPEETLCHISFYEAEAFAQWKGKRLPTEFEWEVAAPQLQWGKRWEWTHSAYLPYPNFQKAAGALGEYNGKFMINQMVLRGGSVATPPQHTRATYRNFFHADKQWQFTGIRLVEEGLV